MKAWKRVLNARNVNRPLASDYINVLFDDFIELHGDRLYADDAAVIGGIATLDGMPVTVIAQEKGKNLKEKVKRNFGSPNPEGYRKSLRLMRQAEKFGRPIITLVDTQGAYCGLGAEERGQGEAIAKNLMEMSGLKVPIISIVIGEGGSGGALALAVADRVWMLENAIYSILSPEGFASILYKDATKAKEAAEIMKLTAQDLYELGIIEEIIQEPGEGAHESFDEVASTMKQMLIDTISQLGEMEIADLVEARYLRYRNFQ